MRITEGNKQIALQRQIARAQERTSVATEQIATGLRVQRPSDDPKAAGAMMRMRALGARQDSYAEAGRVVEAELNAVDQALVWASDLVSQAISLAVGHGSGPQTGVQFAAARELATDLRATLIDVANSEWQGRFLFGGVRDGSRPFDPDGTFVGSRELRTVEVQPVTVVSQVSGADVFGVDGADPLFGLLDQLAGALAVGDQDQIRGLIEPLRRAHGNIANGLQDAGYGVTVIEQARNFSEFLKLQSVAEESAQGDADLAQAYSELEMAQTALQAVATAQSKRSALDIFRYL